MSKEIQIHNATQDIVVYHSEDNTVRLDVQLAEETVWLTQLQMAVLFDATVPNISMHIRNIFKEEELTREATVKDFLIVQTEGGREVSRRVQCYNLDVIISVGYRVKSKRGTQFRQWANQVLKNYLLHGYAINNRFENLEQRVAKAEQQIEYFVRTSLPPKEGIFIDGQIYDAFELIERLIKSAKKSILLIDNYVDESVLTMMSEKENGVKVDIYTKEISKALKLAEEKFNSQYKGLSIHQTNSIHDRFLILDDKTIYLIGASLKDAGKRLFAFTELSAERIAELKKAL